MPLIEVQGDMFANGEKVLAHGCNCIGLMGAGVADIVSKRFPVVFEKYQKAIDAGVFNLGYAQFVIDQENDICIYNLATQVRPGKNGSLWGIYLATCNMIEHARARQINRIAIPRIGSGLAGLDWDDCREHIWTALHDTGDGTRHDITIVAYYL